MPPKKLLFGQERHAAGIGLKSLIAITSLVGGCIGSLWSKASCTVSNNTSSKSVIVLDAATSIDAATSDVTGCPSLMAGVGVPTFKTRGDLGNVMQSEGFTVGVELGVQNGHYAAEMLTNWPNCTEYNLVDLCGHQENYHDFANADQETQDLIYADAMNNVKPWEEKIKVCRNYTTECVKTYDDGYFDFIYVDARHDFKGVSVDLAAYWPKLKVGGIMAGHDYVTQDDGPEGGGQDWTTNFDGTKDLTRTVVKGAVDAFAASVCRQVTVSYREDSWNSWAIRR